MGFMPPPRPVQVVVDVFWVAALREMVHEGLLDNDEYQRLYRHRKKPVSARA